jgi:hypothetical protein
MKVSGTSRVRDLKAAETEEDLTYLNPYRDHLVSARQKAQEDYDKTVVTLSGGALGVTFAFLEKVIGKGPAATPEALFVAWLCWAASITSVLASYFLSRLSLHKAIDQVDSGEPPPRKVGGWMRVATETFNILSGVFFIVGVVMAAVFVLRNLRI